MGDTTMEDRQVLGGWRNSLHHPAAVGLCIALLVCVIVMALRSLGALQFLELATYDRFIGLRQATSQRNLHLGVVGLQEADIRRFGYPLPDETLAQVLTTLMDGGARLVGVDIYRDLPVEPGHQQLREVLAREQRLVWIFGFGNQDRDSVPAPEQLQGTGRVGFNDLPLDPDGVVRRGLLYQDDGQQVYPAFSLQMALQLLREQNIVPRPWAENPQVLQLGASPLPPLVGDLGGYQGLDLGGYQFLLDFQGFREGISVVGIGDLLDNPPSEWIRDRVIFVGTLARSVNDSVLVPSPPGHDGNRQLRGVFLQALVTDQLMRLAAGESRLMGAWSQHGETAWVVLWGILGALVALAGGSFSRVLALGLLGLVGLLGIAYGLFLWDLWIPVVPPGLAWVMVLGLSSAYLGAQEKAQRARLMQLFSRHVSAGVAELIWSQRETLLEGGRLLPRRVTATVLFTDLVGFTAIAEGQDPPVLMDWLNHYMSAMSAEVLSRGGVIDKYIGDAIMAVFGVPLARHNEAERDQDAHNAVDAALAMGETLSRLNLEWHQQGLPQVGMRVGIYTGPLVAGSLGGSEHLEYTVIGDTVNTASRLESFDKSLPPPEGMAVRILIGETTRQRIAGDFRVESVGQVSLKGKDQGVKVFRVLGRQPQQ